MLVNDGLQNVVASLGNEKDKASFTSWRVTPQTPDYWEQIYRSSAFGRKIVDIPVDDMTRRWRGWSANDDFIEAMEAAEKQFQVRSKIAAAKRWARLYGASALILGINPSRGLPSEPLDATKLQKGDLAYIHVEIGLRLTIEAWETDITSPGFGQPRSYLYTPSVRGGLGEQVRIHASRVIPFAGVPLPPIAALSSHTWGDSVLTTVEQQLNTAGSALAVIASLLYETKLDVIKTDLSGVGTPEGEDRIKKRFALASLLKSINNTLLLGNGEEFEQKTFNFAGLPEIHIRLLQELSGAADIPATRFLSQSPAGLQSTGESDVRNYYDMISAKQEAEFRPVLERLDPILIANGGIAADDGAFFYFHPLWQESAKDKAENAFKRAQSVKLIQDTGLIPDPVLSKALVSQLVEDGTYPGLDDAMSEHVETRGELNDIPEGDDDDEDADTGNVLPFARRLAQDAAPRTLYVSRKLKNAGDLIAWARSQGFKNLMPAGEMHTTVIYSRAPVDWFAVGTAEERILVPRGGPRAVEQFDGGAIVLLYSDWSIRWRHESLREVGCSWDYDEFQAHVTFSTGGEDVDLSKVEPYQGKIEFGPEHFEEIVAETTASA